jgi:plastocyanin
MHFEKGRQNLSREETRMSRFRHLPSVAFALVLTALAFVVPRPPLLHASPSLCAAAPAVNSSLCSVDAEFNSLGNPVFAPNDVIVTEGLGVEWQNFTGAGTVGSAAHTTTSNAGDAVSWNATLCNPAAPTCTAANSSFEDTFTGTTGSFAYHCNFHASQGMTGTVQVQSPTATQVARFSSRRTGALVEVRWRMADLHGIAGFIVYAGHQRLTPSAMPAHPWQRTYHLTARLPHPVPLYLDVVLSNNTVNVFGPYRSR